MTIALIILLLVCSLLLGVWAVRGLREDPSPVDDLRAAISELETAIGNELLPVLRRFNDRLERWHQRHR